MKAQIASTLLVKKNTVSAIIVVLISACTALFSSASNLPTATLLALVLSLSLLIYSAKKFGILHGVTVFAVLLSMFHIGMVVPIYVFSAPEPFVTRRWLDSPDLPFALALYNLALGSLVAGSLLGGGKKTCSYVFSTYSTKTAINVWLTIFAVNLFGYLAYGLYTGLLTAPDRYLYMALRNQGEAVFLGSFQSLTVLGAIGVMAFGTKKQAYFAAIVATLVFLQWLLLGDRKFFIVTLASFIVILNIRGFKVPFWAWFSGAIGLFLSIPIIRVRRGGVEAFAEGFLDPFYEMGQNIRVVIHTIEAVRNDLWGYEFGATYLSALGRIIPNIAGLRLIVGGERESSPSYIITDLFNPGGAGLGFSSIAEAYVNFSFLGVIIIFMIFGLAIAMGEKLGRLSPFFLVVYGNVLGSIFMMARGDFYDASRPLGWGIVIVSIVYLIVKRHSKITVKIFEKQQSVG